MTYRSAGKLARRAIRTGVLDEDLPFEVGDKDAFPVGDN